MMKNACSKCNRYFPNNDRLRYCPNRACRANALDNIPDNETYKPCYYDVDTDTITPICKNNKKPEKENDDIFKRYNPADINQESKKTNAIPTTSSKPETLYRKNEKEYRGKISNVVLNQPYSLSFFRKIQNIFRGFHSGNRNEIYFVNEADMKEYVVEFYGEYDTYGTTIPRRDAQITVKAKPDSAGHFMTEKFLINGINARIRNQRQSDNDNKDHSNRLPVFIGLALLGIVVLAFNIFKETDFSYIGGIIQTFGILTVILFVMSLFIRVLRNISLRQRLIGVSLLGGVFTAGMYKIGGIDLLLADISNYFIQLLIIIVIIIYLIRTIISGR